MKEGRGATKEPKFSLLFLGPMGYDLFHFNRPLNFATAPIAEFVAKENFPLATFAEEAFLRLKFLCHCNCAGPRFTSDR